MVRKVAGAVVPLSVGSPPNTPIEQGLHSYEQASLSIQPFGHNTPTLQTGQTEEWSRTIARTVSCNGDKQRPTSA